MAKKRTDYEFDLEDLLNSVTDDIKKTKNFDDVINYDCAIKREIMVGDIVDGTGETINGYIRFWNRVDDENNVPVNERKPIHIYINSYGGNLTDTYTAIDTIKASKTPVYTYNIGAAYSGGFFIFISGHKRFAYPHSSFLFHEGATSTGGTSSQFENYAAFYKRQLAQLKKIVLENTSFTEEYYKEHQKEDLWFDVDEGIKYGFVDEIIKEL